MLIQHGKKQRSERIRRYLSIAVKYNVIYKRMRMKFDVQNSGVSIGEDLRFNTLITSGFIPMEDCFLYLLWTILSTCGIENPVDARKRSCGRDLIYLESRIFKSIFKIGLNGFTNVLNFFSRSLNSLLV